MADELKKITNLPDGTPADTDVVPFVDLATNTTKKAFKSELKGDKGDTGDNATVDAGTTTTLAAGQSATVINVGTTSDAIFNFAIPQGIQGLTGATGAKVTSVAFSGNDIVFTLDDSSTVTLTNAKIDLKGDKGDQGIQGLTGDKGDTGNTGLTGDKGDKGDAGAKITSAEFVGNDLVFTLSDSSTATITGAKTDLQGIQGIQGIQGVTGNGISNISLISTVGLVKTYRITYTDDTTFDYTVTDGANGTGTLSSVVAGTNISIDNTDVNNPVINNTQNISGKEDVSNKKTSLADNSDTFYPTQKAVKTAVDAKQDTLAFTPEDSANKENTTLDTSTTKYPTNRLVKEYADGKVEDNITDGHTTIAPSGNAVFDALALKASLTGAETLTNKRNQPRTYSTTSLSTLTPEIDTYNIFTLTAQTSALTVANHSTSTPADGEMILIEMVCDGTVRALTFGTNYVAKAGTALPTTLVVNKRTTLLFKWCSDISKYNLLTVGQE